MTAEEHDLEQLRPASFAIAYRMLGSVSEAERLGRSVCGARKLTSRRGIDNQRTCRPQGTNSVRDVRSDHGNIAGSQDALITVDADREFALDHRPSLLFDMLVFMDRGRARSDRVAGQRHALAMHRESLQPGTGSIGIVSDGAKKATS